KCIEEYLSFIVHEGSDNVVRRYIGVLVFMSLLLVGCSGTEVEGEGKGKSFFESEIDDMLAEHDVDDHEIINLDIKDNYIYIISYSKSGPGYLFLSIIKKEHKDLRWIMGEKFSPPVFSLADKEAPIMTVIKPK